VSHQAAAQELERFIREYGPSAGPSGPEKFVREQLGALPDEWQLEVLHAIGSSERRISIRSCHGPGKTCVAAWVVVHRLVTHFPQRTVVTAPTKAQLQDALFAEVKVWLGLLPPVLRQLFEVKNDGIFFIPAPEESYLSVRTARAETPEALQGVHCEGGFVLLIADEASGVPEKIFEAAVGSMSGANATTLLLSNPTRSTGFFWKTHQPNSGWWIRRVSWTDSPRVTPTFEREVAQIYGEDSSAYRVRVLGEFPRSDDDTVVPFELIESARNRELFVRPSLEVVWGLDVARFGDARNVLVKRNARCVLSDILVWEGTDLMATAGRVKLEWDKTLPTERPTEILVDVIGYGGGVVDRLVELKLPVRGINVAESSAWSDRYRNLRAELWFKAREWLDRRDVALPSNRKDPRSPVEILAQELALPRYSVTSSGKLMVESKVDLKRRGHKSPDVADALILTFASEPAAVVNQDRGQSWGGVAWRDPVSRNRARW